MILLKSFCIESENIMTTRDEIRQWLIEGKEKNHKYMMVICDTYDHEDFPVYYDTRDEVVTRLNKTRSDNNNMERTMEIYDLSMSIKKQLEEHTAWHI